VLSQYIIVINQYFSRAVLLQLLTGHEIQFRNRFFSSPKIAVLLSVCDVYALSIKLEKTGIISIIVDAMDDRKFTYVIYLK